MADREPLRARLLDSRGILHPAALPTFHRLPPPADVAPLVRWFWIPEWEIAPGRVSRQQLIPHPASNLVVEADEVTLSGPSTRLAHRDLSGRGWAVGALLRPAGVALVTDDPGALRDGSLVLDLPALRDPVTAAMTRDEDGDGDARRAAAAAAYADWLRSLAIRRPPPEGALLANALADLVDADSSVLRVEQVAERLGVSARTVQRLCRRFVGVPPAAMIRRRRLQEAAERLRTDPDAEVAAVAADLGYADQAHLAADFRSVLGFTPTGYRGSTRPV